MEGMATIEIAPTYPEFSVQHATKKNSHSSATLMSSQVFPTYPVQYIPSLPPQYCVISRESLAPVSNLNELSQSQLPVPSIRNFWKRWIRMKIVMVNLHNLLMHLMNKKYLSNILKI